MCKKTIEYKMINCQYISKGIGEDYRNWSMGEKGRQANRIFIESPTGSGKTHFLTNKLLPYAIEENRSIIYICNRDALKQQIIQKVRKSKFDLEEYCSEDKQITIFIYPDKKGRFCVVNYQALTDINKNAYHPIHMIINPYYIVMDEVQFFLDDALFNNDSDKIFNSIFSAYKHRVQIFLSATMLDFWNLYTLTFDLYLPGHPHQRIYFEHFYEYNIDYYINEYTKPRYNIILYNDDDFLYNKIKNSNDEKWLVFTSTIKNGFKQKAEIKKTKKCSYITANSKKTKYWEKLINSEKFDSDVLIATKVLDNGFNIVDEKLKNIVLPFMYPTELIQMIGRKRFTDTESCVNVYVQCLTSQKIKSRIKKFESLLNKYHSIASAKSMIEKLRVIKKYWKSDENSNFDFKCSKKRLLITYNKFTILKLYLELDFYRYLDMHFNDPQVYFDLIKEWLGNNINEIKNISQKKSLYEFLEDQVGVPVTDQEMFYRDFLELYKIYCKQLKDKDFYMTEDEYKNLLRLRQAKGREKSTINEGLEKLKLPFVVKKIKNNWVVLHTAAEE